MRPKLPVSTVGSTSTATPASSSQPTPSPRPTAPTNTSSTTTTDHVSSHRFHSISWIDTPVLAGREPVCRLRVGANQRVWGRDESPGRSSWDTDARLSLYAAGLSRGGLYRRDRAAGRHVSGSPRTVDA